MSSTPLISEHYVRKSTATPSVLKTPPSLGCVNIRSSDHTAANRMPEAFFGVKLYSDVMYNVHLLPRTS